MSIEQLTNDTPVITNSIPTEKEVLTEVTIGLVPEVSPSDAAKFVAKAMTRAHKLARNRRHKKVTVQDDTVINPRKCFTPEGRALKDDVYTVWFCPELSTERRDSFVEANLCSAVLFEAKLIRAGLTSKLDRHAGSVIFNRVFFEILKNSKPELLADSE